jgi:hypothetical protein
MEKLTSVRLPKKDRPKNAPVEASVGSDDVYPWGLRLRFEDEIIDKFSPLLRRNIGDKVSVEAVGEVTSISSNKRKDGENYDSVEIQITAIRVSGAKDYDDGFEEATKK